MSSTVTVDPIIKLKFGLPPDGLDLDEEQYTMYNAVTSVALGIAIACVALRLYVRRLKGPMLGSDDYAILLSTVCQGQTWTATTPQVANKDVSGIHRWYGRVNGSL